MEVIRDNRFGNRYLIRNIMKMVPFGMGFVFLWRDWGRFDLQFWLGIGCFVGGLVSWAWQDRQVLRSYCCPRCGRHLSRPTLEQRVEGDPICFYCESCDVEWDTKLRQ